MKKNERKQKVYEFIKRNCDMGISPTIREICEQLNISSTSSAHIIVKQLAAEGLVEKSDHSTRSLKIPNTFATQVPVLKSLDQQDAFTNLKNIERYVPIGVHPDQVEGSLFAFAANDAGLASHGILQGDYVIARQTNHVENNTLAVLLVGEQVWIRYYVKKSNIIELRANDETVKTILTDHCKVLGEVCGCVRYSI